MSGTRRAAILLDRRIARLVARVNRDARGLDPGGGGRPAFDQVRLRCENSGMDIDPALLAAVFDSHPVVTAYLFGSVAAGQATPLSDVDIAVILEDGVRSPGEVQAMLISDLMLALRRSDVDVVVLNAAPVLLRQRAIEGRLVYCRDDSVRSRFEAATRREFFDTQSLREAQDRALLERHTLGR